ncbi:MAG: UPF0489 family protein [Dehalococcoidales bacterium]|jgi:hypothetical protein
MRILDLDLDFFLNDNAYSSGHESGRLGPEYKPWSVLKVKHFLEQRCSLSPDAPVSGRTVASHDGVLDFWRQLVKTGKLNTPFEVIHVDAHPDLWTGDVLYLTSGLLYLEPESGLAKLKQKLIHAGNYLTFAIASGWIDSLVWVPLRQHPKNRPAWDADARSILSQLKKPQLKTAHALPAGEKGRGVPFQVIPWQKFKVGGTFDYIALSRSPQFTPPESDALVPIIEGYMKLI